MTTVVVPFRSGGKTRLPEEIRVEVALAMLGDVLEACVEHGCDVRLVTDDGAASLVADGLGVELVDDPGGGQGAAVAAGLRGLDGVCLVVNADLPRIRPSDLTALAYAPHAGAAAIVPAADGTTNALGLPHAEVFQPLYGPQFRRKLSQLKKLQDLLGRLNDLATARVVLENRPGAVPLTNFLDREEKEVREKFETYWKEQMDAADSEARWIRYLTQYAGQRGRSTVTRPASE